MPKHQCPYPNCTYETKDISDDLAAVMIKVHAEGAHLNQNKSARVENVSRPVISAGGTSEKWGYFLIRWTEYKSATNISGKEKIIQLLDCCEPQLREDVTTAAGGSLMDKPEEEVLDRIRALAVRHENILVARIQLQDMQQKDGEPIRAFAARLKGQSSVCKFVQECPSCTTHVDFTNQMIRDVLVKGIVDSDIQLNLLSVNNQEMSLEEVIQYIEAKESGKRSLSKLAQNYQAANASRSQYQRAKIQNTGPAVKCTYCGKSGHGKNAPLKVRKDKCTAFGKVCSYCGIPNHFAQLCRNRIQESKLPNKSKSSHIEDGGDDVNECPVWQELCVVGSKSACNNYVNSIGHYIYSKPTQSWVMKPSKPQPLIKLTASTHQEDYQQLGFNLLAKPSRIEILALPDTGCQSCLAGMNFASQLGLSEKTLLKTNLTMFAANKSKINVLGAAFVRFQSQSTVDTRVETRQMVYITDSTKNIYLSREACADLGIISQEFPSYDFVAYTANQDAAKSTQHTLAECGCPRRSLPLEKPTDLPFEVKSDTDIKRLKDWLLEYYSASSFNTCPHQPLPKMHGPPLRLMVDPDAQPVAHHTPINVPLHWAEKVKAGLDQDVRLGVIQPVPIGQPVTWCHRMVVCAKKDGRPRRTVDFQALNKFACRETHHTQSPYHQARMVPPGKLKTVFDCWNGYHSISLHEQDYHLTAFITPWGRYQYKVAPQGYIASGDGYCRRFDEIVSGVKNFTKCIDDALLWSDNIKESFLQAVNWLDICGRNGIILNPEKFVFAQRTVEFAGFTITDNSIKPCAKYMSAIRDFPTPSSLTDVRSWFGLVNQVAYAFAKTDVMKPFRQLLKSNVRFSWDPALEEIFQKSKLIILNQIEHGVKIFSKHRPTCLATDWSKNGIGYWLLQKHCQCEPLKPFCCRDGWQVTVVGSRFTSTAESRYAPIEGEALAVVYALEHARHFVLGCDKLLVTVDHKPLLSLFSDRSLDIANNRLRNLKEKTLRYRFTMCHISGMKHKATDAISRRPVGTLNPPQLLLPDDDDDDVDQSNPALKSANALSSARGAGLPNVYSEECPDPALKAKGALGIVRGATSTSDGEDFGQFALTNFLSVLHSHEKPPHLDGIGALDALHAITWKDVQLATTQDQNMKALLDYVESGFPSCRSQLPVDLQVFFQHKKYLTSCEGVVMYKKRIVVPKSLRKNILALLHCAHQGTSKMTARAETSVFWPGITGDIQKIRDSCASCNRMAPSQPQAPPAEINHPAYPFQMICADFLSFKGRHYLVIVDRYSHWPIIEKSTEGSKGLIDCLRRVFATFGVPDEIATDGGLEFVAEMTQRFLKVWGVHHRISSVAFPHSNCRAEIGVKNAKRILCDNTAPNGSLDIDAFRIAMLNYRNTPAPDTGISPAQCVFGREIKDLVPVHRNKYKPHPTWSETLDKREEAMRKRHLRMKEKWSEHTKILSPLQVGDHVRVQNQVGNSPLKWDRTGRVVEARKHDQYIVKIDGSNRTTLRNRRFLRKFLPIYDDSRLPPPAKSNNLPLDEESAPPETRERTINDPPGSVASDVPDESASRDRIPLSLRRLQDFNKRGLRE